MSVCVSLSVCLSHPQGKHAKGKQYGGHSAHVTNVRWLCDGSKLISTGGADLSVMVWAYSGAEGTDGGFPASQQVRQWMRGALWCLVWYVMPQEWL